MILYGLRYKRLEIVDDRMTRCASCQNGPVAHNVFQSYAHIYYIPLFPVNKKIVTKCISCGVENENKMMPTETKLSIKNSMTKRTPIWMYSGLLIIFLGICGIGYGMMKDSQKESQWLASPMEGDRYLVKDDGGFTYFRIEEIGEEGDMLMSPFSSWFTSKSQAKLSQGDFETESSELVEWSQEEFTEMKNNGSIVSTIR